LIAKDSILSKLENSKGVLELSDKSDSEKIKTMLNMSKKTFKRAIGMLYKEGLVRILEDKIERVNAE